MNRLATFAENRAGNFSIYAALVSLPLLTAAGLAVDYYALTNQKKTLQQAVDSAVLAVASEGEAIDIARGETIARDYLEANFGGDVERLVLQRTGTSTSLSATARTQLFFGGLTGATTRTVSAYASADLSAANYEIGLVLDTTGSMSGGKIAALRDAATALVDDMSGQVTNPKKLKFGVVPYAAFVNVGPQYGPSFDKNGKVDKKTGAEWLDIEGKAKFPELELGNGANRFELFYRLGKTWPGCVETRYPDKGTPYDVMDIAADPKDRQSLFVPAFSIDEPDLKNRWGGPLFPNSYIASNADVLNQSAAEIAKKIQKYGYDPVKDTGGAFGAVPIDSSPSNFYSNETDPKGPGYGCEIEPLLPLTSDAAKVKAKIAALKANGSTNIVEGVMWGWRVLSSRAPFSEGVKEGVNGTHKVMVLLTDGTNSFGNLPNPLGSGYTSFGYLADQRIGPSTLNAVGTTSAMDVKTLAGCTNAKKDGIEIYTVLLEENNVKTSKLLEQCATSPDHFFNVPDRTKLKAVFSNIVKKVGKLRLSS